LKGEQKERAGSKQGGGRCSVRPFPAQRKATMILHLLAFLAVICWALDPRAVFPTLKTLVLIYGFGLGPQP
jgi:hypothetical protein